MLFRLVTPVYAQCTPGEGDSAVDLGSCLTLKNGQEIRNVYENPAFLINLLVQNLFVLGGIVLFAMIIYAGFKFMRGGSKGVEEAKGVITTAALGFVLMFSAYWIVQIIRLITGANLVL